MEFLLIGGAIAVLLATRKIPRPGVPQVPKIPKTEKEAGLPPGTYKAKDVIRKITSPPPGQPKTGLYPPPDIFMKEEPGTTEKIVKRAKIAKDFVTTEVGKTEEYFTGTRKFLEV